MRLVCALGLLAALAAQDRPDTVIRTTTRLVQIRMMAQDSSGKPVTDLRKEELQLQDDRKPQPIAFLTAEGGASQVGASTPANSSAAPAAAEYAVILIDWLNPSYRDRVIDRELVYKLLRNLHPRQQIALYVLGKPSRLLHRFTSDTGDLLQTLADTPMDPEDAYDPVPVGFTEPRYKTWSTLTTEEKIYRFNVKILDTFETLNKLADGLGRVPGRKDLVWVSSGFPLVVDGHAVAGAMPGEIEYPENMQETVAKLNRADIAVYTVDARGLVADGRYGDSGTLQEFSQRTGGTAFLDRNDLDEGMRLALEDTRVSYTLGFTVPVGAVPGLHRILLRTTRAGVTLRYRESYQLDDAGQ
jgi:VWFA-related protein